MSHRLPTGLVLGLTLAGLATGGALALAGRGDAADAAWAATAAIAGAADLVGGAARWRDGTSASTLIALLAMAGALALGEYLAGGRRRADARPGGNALERLRGAPVRGAS